MKTIKHTKARVFNILRRWKGRRHNIDYNNYFAYCKRKSKLRRIKNKQARIEQKKKDYKVSNKKGKYFMWELW